MIKLNLPLGPSVNAMFPGKARRYASPEYKKWKREGAWEILAQKPEPVTGRYELKIYVPAAMRGDVSNRIKAVEDLLVSHAVTPDDKHCWRVSAERSEGVAKGRCTVEVRAL